MRRRGVRIEQPTPSSTAPGRGRLWPACAGGNAGRPAPDLPSARQEKPGAWWATACSGKPPQDEGTIEKIEPRRNLFYRQDEIRTKSFAANLDQVLILIAAEPEFSDKPVGPRAGRR